MRVGHFVSFGIGGADRAAFNLLLGLKQNGTVPRVFYSSVSIPARTQDQDPDLPLLSTQALFEQEFELNRIERVDDLLAFDLDILHTHRSGDDGWLLPDLENLDRKFKILETNFHGYRNTPADMRIYPSEALMMKRRIPRDPHNKMIFNPIAPPLSQENFRERLSISPEKVVLGRVGRADRSIYSPKLLRAFAKLERETETHLIWVGASSKARRDAERFGVTNITWVKPVLSPEIMSSYFNTFDVYCHVNALGETFGNTVAEAMVHGKPVVSLKGKWSYPQAQFELLDDMMQTAKSKRQFIGHLRRLIADAPLRKDLGLRNQLRANELFEPGRVAKRYLGAYDEVLNGK